MMMGQPCATDIVAAVRACVGTRFRSQGRTPRLGLDCVGVALVAARAAGMPLPVLPVYQLGGDNEAAFDGFPALAGLVAIGEAEVRDDAVPGDVWLFAPAPGQRHLAVQVTEGSADKTERRRFVHAHAGVGRVVESPADPAWVVVGKFRFP